MIQNKKVLQLISTLGFYGAENVMIELSQSLLDSSYEPIIGIISTPGGCHLPVEKEALRRGLKVVTFPCMGKFDLATIIKIRRYIKENRIKIIHTHNYKSSFYGWLASANLNVKRIVTCHNWLGDNFKMKFYKSIELMLFNRFNKIVTVSDILLKEVLKEGVAVEKVRMVNNGIDLQRFRLDIKNDDLRRQLGIKISDFVVGGVGRLVPEKGYHYLIEAIKKLTLQYSSIKLLIIGDGPLESELRTQVKDLKLENNVKLLGLRNDIPVLLSSMDIFIMTSTNEGMPMALLEAMAMKKPVIATRVGAISKIISDGVNGLLIPPKNVDSTVAAVTYLLQNREKGSIFAEKGFESVKNEYSSKKMTQHYAEIYDEILSGCS